MAISTTLTFTQNADGEWALDTGQADYNIKKQMMAKFGNVGLHMFKDEDVAWVTRVCELLYPHVTLQFAYLNERSTLFDGVDEFVDMGDAAAFKFERTDPFSLSMWVKTTNGALSTIISKKSSTPANPGYLLKMLATGKPQVYLVGGANNEIDVKATTDVINDGLWHSLIVTYDGSSTAVGVKMYIDGTLIALTVSDDTLSTSILNTRAFKVGVLGTSSEDWVGNVDEVAVWDKELSAAEVSDIHNAGAPGDLSAHSAEINLVSWWRAGDADMFPTWTDSKGTNDGTMTNMEAGDFVEDTA